MGTQSHGSRSGGIARLPKIVALAVFVLSVADHPVSVSKKEADRLELSILCAFAFYLNVVYRIVRSFMKKILYPVFTAILIAMLIISPAGAGGMKIGFSLGSLVADVLAWGIGSTNWRYELAASGTASVICTNNGSNDVPGQSAPHVDGTGSTTVGPKDISKNGKVAFTVVAKADEELSPVIPWDVAGCQNSNWTARYDFVYWESATLSRIDPLTNTVVESLKFQCVTTRTGPNSTPSTFDDGTVACTQIN